MSGKIERENTSDLFDEDTTQLDTSHNVTELMDILKREYKNYVQNKVLYDCIQECAKSESLQDNLKSKVNSILMSESCVQCLNVSGTSQGNKTKLLGVELNTPELSFSEASELKNAINKLNAKHLDSCSDCKKTTNHNSNEALDGKQSSTFQLTIEDKMLVEYQQQLVQEQKTYVKNLLLQMELLEELKNLRLATLPKLSQRKVEECQIKAQMNVLRSQLADNKLKVDIFLETGNSLSAYKELVADIKEQQEECRRDIEKLQDAKQKYKAASCKQYDDILQSYLQYKASLEKKKLLYDCIKN